MVISIPPVTLVLIIIVISNCIISFGKSNLMNKYYLILSSVFSIIGIVGLIIIRPCFIASLNRNAIRREFDSDFVTWAIEKFDSFVVISIIVTCSIIIFLLLYLFLNKKKSGFVWDNITGIVIALVIINFVTQVWYSFGTINKFFDIAGYISQLSIAEFFALHIPLVVKRMLMLKKSNSKHKWEA